MKYFYIYRETRARHFADINNYIKHAGPSKYGEDGGSKSRREQWDNERDEEKVADVKRKQSRCDLTRTRPEPRYKARLPL